MKRSTLVCRGCGFELPKLRDEPLVFRCARAESEPTVDHVLARRLDHTERFSPDSTEKNPFLRFRGLDHVYLGAREAGLSDQQFVDIVRRLDDAVASVDGHGFFLTPYGKNESLGNALGFSGQGGLWIKNETGNVSGSHKGRHLFSVLVHLEVVRELGLSDVSAELAIASCGNAALAAAVLAKAAQRHLRVFVPDDADANVVTNMRVLGAQVETCSRERGAIGDPTYHRFREAILAGSIPFSCQGPDQALAIQGGKTIAWEMIYSDEPRPERLFVQVGGGALASAVFSAFEEAAACSTIDALPRFHAVQTRGCFPLVRAYMRVMRDIERRHSLQLPEDDEDRATLLRDRLGANGIDEVVQYAARNRAQFMEPWEETPHSIAHGILDDETYDWLAIVRGMLLSAGYPIIVDDDDIRAALEVARRETGIDVCATGAASLAGLCVLARARPWVLRERAAVLFTGRRRDGNQ